MPCVRPSAARASAARTGASSTTARRRASRSRRRSPRRRAALAAPPSAQLIEYLKRPEKGFMVVIAPAPVTLADDAVVAAARCLQIERLGARVQFIDADPARSGDALGAILESWAAATEDGAREGAQRPAPQGRPRRGAGPAALRLPGRAAQPPRARRRRGGGRALHLSPLPARRPGHPPDRPPPQRRGPAHASQPALEHGQHPRHPAQPRLPRHLPAPRRARARAPTPPSSRRTTSARCRSA